jgi:hypothetical protein
MKQLKSIKKALEFTVDDDNPDKLMSHDQYLNLCKSTKDVFTAGLFLGLIVGIVVVIFKYIIPTLGYLIALIVHQSYETDCYYNITGESNEDRCRKIGVISFIVIGLTLIVTIIIVIICIKFSKAIKNPKNIDIIRAKHQGEIHNDTE